MILAHIKECLLLGLIFSFSCALHAQKRVFLINQESKDPIPFAHILSSDYHTVSGMDGAFDIPISMTDSIQISCVGFNTLRTSNSLADTVFLEPSTRVLEPFYLSGNLGFIEKLFQAVSQMQKSGVISKVKKVRYWEAVLFKDTLVSSRRSQYNNGKELIELDKIAPVDCRKSLFEFDSSPFELISRNMVQPAAGSLKRSNVDSWKYDIVSTEVRENDELVLGIVAEYISNNDAFRHSFSILLNEDRKEIEEINVYYKWNRFHPFSLIRNTNQKSALKGLNAKIIYRNGEIAHMFYEFEFSICDRISSSDCLPYKFFQEASFVEGIEALVYNKFRDMECD